LCSCPDEQKSIDMFVNWKNKSNGRSTRDRGNFALLRLRKSGSHTSHSPRQDLSEQRKNKCVFLQMKVKIVVWGKLNGEATEEKFEAYLLGKPAKASSKVDHHKSIFLPL